MKNTDMRELLRRFAAQHGLVGRDEARLLGIDSRMERRRIESGEWESLGRHVIRMVAAPATGEQSLMAACIEAGPGAVASHQSAAWLWELAPAPSRHWVTVPRARCPQVPCADVHRMGTGALSPVPRRGIPVTDPARTLVDFASIADPQMLDFAVDRALARRLVTVEAILAEIERESRPGRRGIRSLRDSLRRRGLIGAPHPSVLESALLRLLLRHRIEPMAVEVHIHAEGHYRVDAAVSEEVLVEVDGYAYHHSPEQKTEDERRRNRIRLSGKVLLVYTWRDVIHDGKRVVEEIRQALAQSWLRRVDSSCARPPARQLTGSIRRPPIL
ncbi:MAG TPA: hypothetical protein VFV02_06410 [Acidimicrobiales bacterium]|nr:hypothetical protein [Acidimicrobiales bacterium]